MNKNLLLITIITSLLSTGCGIKTEPQTQRTPEEIAMSEILTQIEEDRKDPNYEPPKSEISKYNRYGDNSITIVESKTKYTSEFSPTVHLEFKNTSGESIQAFEIKADGYDLVKQIKVNLEPEETYKKTIKISKDLGASGNIDFKVSKVIFSDGEMVNTERYWN